MEVREEVKVAKDDILVILDTPRRSGQVQVRVVVLHSVVEVAHQLFLGLY